jgi:DNA polymerase-3 subunit chi
VTRIDFYVDVNDRLTFACRLVAKALQQSVKVLIFAPAAQTAEAVDRMLWVTPPTGFFPHCMSHDRLAAETPVVIARQAEVLPHDELLINLHDEWPAPFARFQRLAEIVSRDETDRHQARARYKFYRDRGYQIQTHRITTAGIGNDR